MSVAIYDLFPYISLYHRCCMFGKDRYSESVNSGFGLINVNSRQLCFLSKIYSIESLTMSCGERQNSDDINGLSPESCASDTVLTLMRSVLTLGKFLGSP